MKQAVIYARVSTKNQEIENQLAELREFCSRKELEIYQEFIDVGESGAREDRPQLLKMLEEAHQKKFDILVVWSLDRLGRSLKQLVEILNNLNNYNIDFISLKQPFDTTTASGKLQFQLIGAFAEFERSLIRERIKAALNRKKEKGEPLGRPGKELDSSFIARLRNEGLSYRQIAAKLKVSHETVRKHVNKTYFEKPSKSCVKLSQKS